MATAFLVKLILSGHDVFLLEDEETDGCVGGLCFYGAACGDGDGNGSSYGASSGQGDSEPSRCARRNRGAGWGSGGSHGRGDGFRSGLGIDWIVDLASVGFDFTVEPKGEYGYQLHR